MYAYTYEHSIQTLTMTVFLRLYLSAFTTDFDGETEFLRLYLSTFTTDFDGETEFLRLYL